MGLLRLFLAMVVANDHFRVFVLNPSGLMFDGYWQLGVNGGHAVMCFYVISGFLISYALSKKYSGNDGTFDFYRSRFLRIYPLYWGLIVAFIIFNVVGTRDFFINSFHDGQFKDLLLGFGLIGSDWLVSFRTYPVPDVSPFMPTMQIAWTLGAELTFYLMAPFVLRSNTWALGLFTASLIARLIVIHTYGFHTVLSYTFFPTALMFFLLGHFARIIYEQYTFKFGHWLILAGIVAFTVKTWSTLAAFDSIWFYVFLAFFALFVPYLFDLTKNSKLFNFMGDLTYPLYLIHTTIIFVVYLTGPMWGMGINKVIKDHFAYQRSGIVAVIFFMLICIAVSAFISLLIEPQLKRLFEKLWPKRERLTA